MPQQNIKPLAKRGVLTSKPWAKKKKVDTVALIVLVLIQIWKIDNTKSSFTIKNNLRLACPQWAGGYENFEVEKPVQWW
ncbi:MAG: hypothetical protein ABII97_00935 [Patescibacteria group bacterium]